MSILEISQRLRHRELSPLEVTHSCLTQIERLNPTLNAFITVLSESALAEARNAEEEIMRGKWRGPLHGIPIALKDNIDTAGVRTTAGSNLFKDRVPAQDAEVVRRLKAAGAILIGKTNLHEFAYGGSSVISAFGPVRNPRDPSRIAGGSSGGSTVAVASGMCLAAIGTDTAGSIREPAACCGVVGVKPTYGRVSSRGVIPLSVSLDHTGPITSSVADAAVLLQVLAGYDPGDPTSSDVPVMDFTAACEQKVSDLRVGVPERFFFDNVDPQIEMLVRKAPMQLDSMVRAIEVIDLDVPTDRTLQAAESFRYHAKWAAKSAGLYQPETLRRIRSGSEITDTTYAEKLNELKQIRESIAKTFEKVDVLLTPTIPILPPRLDGLLANPDQLRPAELELLRNTRPFNIWGIPAISVPCGNTPEGLPVGLQIAAAPWQENLTLAVAAVCEAAAPASRRPS